MRTSLYAILSILLLSCASSDEAAFDPGAPVPDAGTDARSDAPTCTLSTCPVPPGGAQKCCAGAQCGYLGGSICYPLKDGGSDSGAAGGKP